MLKPLLLLCCAATIVSASEPKNDAQNNATLSPLETSKIPELINADQKLSTTTSNTNVHATSELTGGENIVIPTTVSSKTTHLTPTTVSSKTTHSTPTTSPSTKPITTSTSTTVTPAPTTSTTPAPITPLPPPSTARWVVHQNKTLCIIVEVAAQLNISYVDTSNVTMQKALDIPVNGSVTGNCGTNEQNLIFSWKSQNDSIINDTFTLHFVKNETEKHYSLHHLEISLALTEFPNDKSNKTVTLVHVVPQFNTGLSNSYRCFKEQTLNLTFENKNETVGHLKVSNLQFQAFKGDNSTTFGIAQDCSFNTPDIVPITVGCALAGLVVVVLIAYLVGRRRSQARGYLSM